MPSVLITGTNRGIGLGLAKSYLDLGYTVVGAVRDPSKQPALEGLITVKLDAQSESDPFEAVSAIKAKGINSLDLVIANAGVGGDMTPFGSIKVEELMPVIKVNTIAPLLLFQATLPILAKDAKFVVVSTMMAMTSADMYHNAGQDAYRISKNAVNFIARTLHFQHPELTIFTISPGWVDTDMGSWGASSRGMAAPPQKLSDTLPKIVATITGATKDRESGHMVDYDGTIAEY